MAHDTPLPDSLDFSAFSPPGTAISNHRNISLNSDGYAVFSNSGSALSSEWFSHEKYVDVLYV